MNVRESMPTSQILPNYSTSDILSTTHHLRSVHDLALRTQPLPLRQFALRTHADARSMKAAGTSVAAEEVALDAADGALAGLSDGRNGMDILKLVLR